MCFPHTCGLTKAKWTLRGHAGWSGNILLVKDQPPLPSIITLVTLQEVVRGFIVLLIAASLIRSQ